MHSLETIKALNRKAVKRERKAIRRIVTANKRRESDGRDK